MSIKSKYEIKEKSFEFEDEIDDEVTAAYLNKVAEEGWDLNIKQIVSGIKDDVFHLVVSYTHSRKRKDVILNEKSEDLPTY